MDAHPNTEPEAHAVVPPQACPPKASPPVTLPPKRNPSAFGFHVDPEELLPPERYPFGTDPAQELGGVPAPARRVVALARALASSPVWKEMDEAVLAVRTEPPEGIAFLGHFSDEEVSRLEWLSTQLRSQLPHLSYVSWARAEEGVEALAARLVDRFGHREVREMRFAAIPRGGLIVLGMLAYALDLDSDRLFRPDDGRGDGEERGREPLVVVDDCALSGLRFGEFLRTRIPAADEVVFAHLYSHPDLRKSIEEREPRVTAVLAARDLQDLAPALLEEELSQWRTRWDARSDDDAYWVGRPEHVAFAWGEPDLTFWDPSALTSRAGWRLVPPEACLKNRSGAALSPPRLQVQVPAKGRMRLAPGTFHGELDGRVLVAELESGQVVSLDGVAADLWRGFLRPGDPEVVLDRLEDRYEVSREQLRADADAFLRTLRERGLVTATPRFRSDHAAGGPG